MVFIDESGFSLIPYAASKDARRTPPRYILGQSCVVEDVYDEPGVSLLAD